MYCTESDVYDHGVQRGSLPNPARPICAVDVASDSFSLDTHGFEADTPVSFRAESWGSLPSPLQPATTYYARVVSTDVFKVSATEGGAVLSLATAGESVVVFTPLPIAAAIQWAASVIDDMLPSHTVPLSSPYPPLVVAANAELAAHKLLSRTGSASKALSDIIDATQKRLERWGRGVPIRGANQPSTATNLSFSNKGTSAVSAWSKFGGT